MRHFNSAHVWGLLKEFKEKETANGKAYVDVVIDCSSEKYGNVRAFGRLWGKFVQEFLEDFRPGDLVAMRGMLSQYEGRKGAIRTNFTLYGAEHWEPADSKHKHRRAAFILATEVLDIDDSGEETVVHVRFGPQNGDPEEYVIALHPDKILDIEAGGIWRLKGAIEQDEDEWGEVTRAARPVILVVQKMKGPAAQTPAGKDEEDVPF